MLVAVFFFLVLFFIGLLKISKSSILIHKIDKADASSRVVLRIQFVHAPYVRLIFVCIYACVFHVSHVQAVYVFHTRLMLFLFTKSVCCILCSGVPRQDGSCRAAAPPIVCDFHLRHGVGRHAPAIVRRRVLCRESNSSKLVFMSVLVSFSLSKVISHMLFPVFCSGFCADTHI